MDARRAYLVVSDWPFGSLSCVGRTAILSGAERGQHVGVLFCDLTEEEQQLREPWSTDNGGPVASFDYDLSQKLRFQDPFHPDFFGPRVTQHAYPILFAPTGPLLRAAVQAASVGGSNSPLNMASACCDGACSPACSLLDPWRTGSEGFNVSNCVSATARVLAATRVGDQVFTDDELTRTTLGLEQGIATYVPQSMVDELKELGHLGPSVGSTREALAQCGVVAARISRA